LGRGAWALVEVRAELRELSKRMEEEVGRLSREAQEAKQQAWALNPKPETLKPEP